MLILKERIRRRDEEAACEACGWPLYVGDAGYVVSTDPDTDPGENGEVFCCRMHAERWARAGGTGRGEG